MTNLGGAKELMGRRFSGDRTDGPSGASIEMHQEQHQRGGLHGNVMRMEGERPMGVQGRGYFNDLDMDLDVVRNKRSVSVDSGLQQRERGVVVRPQRKQPQKPIYEEQEEEDHEDMELSEGGESVDGGKKRGGRRGGKASSNEGGDEIDDLIHRPTTKGIKRQPGTAKSSSGSRIRGRAAIHNS